MMSGLQQVLDNVEDGLELLQGGLEAAMRSGISGVERGRQDIKTTLRDDALVLQRLQLVLEGAGIADLRKHEHVYQRAGPHEGESAAAAMEGHMNLA